MTAQLTRIGCTVKAEVSLTAASGYDGIILVAESLEKLTGRFQNLYTPLKAQEEIDASVAKDGACVKISSHGGRLVYAPTGQLNRDYDDVRRFADAAAAGIKRAIKAGIKRPLLVHVPDQSYQHADLVTLLGALHALYSRDPVHDRIRTRHNRISPLNFQ